MQCRFVVRLSNHLLWGLTYSHEHVSVPHGKFSSRLTSGPLSHKGKCLKIRRDWVISSVTLVAWWSTVSQSLRFADDVHLLTDPGESSWIAMSEEFLPCSGDFSILMLTGLLSVPLRGKSVEKLHPFKFPFQLLDSSLYGSDIRCLIGGRTHFLWNIRLL